MTRIYLSKRLYLLCIILFMLSFIFVIKHFVPSVWGPIRVFALDLPSTEEVIKNIGPKVRKDLKHTCKDSGVDYPPDKLRLIAIKTEKVLKVWGKDLDSDWTFLTSYPVIAGSGSLGPKLREGDRQMPEGVYSAVSLNPNSDYHLSIKINYPNEFDRKMAKGSGRQDLGDNIFIHGSNVSVGCLAMGNDNIEKLFVLVHDTGLSDTQVLIAPYDLVEQPEIIVPSQAPEWTSRLYKRLRAKMRTCRIQ